MNSHDLKKSKLVRFGILIFLVTLLMLPLTSFAIELKEGTLVSDSLGLSSDNLSGYFNNLFQLALTVGAILAVLIIAIGGLQYMTTDAVFGKTEGRERINQAILGLLMLLAVYLFFNEVNPDILKLDFLLTPVEVGVRNAKEKTQNSTTETTPPSVTVGSTPTVQVQTPSGEDVPEYASKIILRSETCGNPPANYTFSGAFPFVAAHCPLFNVDTQACCVFRAIEAE